MYHKKIFILLFSIFFLVSETGYAVEGCTEEVHKRYGDNLRLAFQNMKEYDTTSLDACSAAIAAISNIAAVISLTTINLGSIINALANAALSYACEYINGKVQDGLGQIQGVFDQANGAMADLQNQRDLAQNTSNSDTYNIILNGMETGVDGKYKRQF